MKTPFSAQKRMDAAFDNYFALSDILREDLAVLLDSETDSQHWRRNYVRVGAALIEGCAHCLREMCVVSFECLAPTISPKETKVLHSEQSFDANKRIKYTLRVAYKLFGVQPTPNFGGQEWQRAQRIFGRRHLLMHPKCPADLEIPDDLWDELREDVTWMIERLFDFIALLQKKHGGSTPP
jgi:hypothetical protein